jgi:hypothetical protein
MFVTRRVFVTWRQPSVAIADIERIDSIVDLIGPEADQRDDRALEIEVSVDAHRIRVHPAVSDAGDRRRFVLHEFESSGGTSREHVGADFAGFEALTRLEADALHPRNDRPVGSVRRVLLQ